MSPTYTWWDCSHKVVSHIADRHLHCSTKNVIKSFYEGKSLEDLSIWPDEINARQGWIHTRPWHYISIDDNETLSTVTRSRNGDVLKALVIQYMKVGDRSLTNQNRWQALNFFVHLTGDIHQPLHVGRKDDLSDNTIDIQWMNQRDKVNLHQVWGGLLIENNLSIRDYAKKLDIASSEDTIHWQTATFADWARESKKLKRSSL